MAHFIWTALLFSSYIYIVLTESDQNMIDFGNFTESEKETFLQVTKVFS